MFLLFECFIELYQQKLQFLLMSLQSPPYAYLWTHFMQLNFSHLWTFCMFLLQWKALVLKFKDINFHQFSHLHISSNQLEFDNDDHYLILQMNSLFCLDFIQGLMTKLNFLWVCLVLIALECCLNDFQKWSVFVFFFFLLGSFLLKRFRYHKSTLNQPYQDWGQSGCQLNFSLHSFPLHIYFCQKDCFFTFLPSTIFWVFRHQCSIQRSQYLSS